MRFGIRGKSTHLVDIGVTAPEGSTQLSLCRRMVKLGPPEELRLGQIADCQKCWTKYTAGGASRFGYGEGAIEAAIQAGGERVGPYEVEGPNSL